MDNKKPKGRRGVTAKSAKMKSESKEASLRRKKITNSRTKVEKEKATKKTNKKEIKKVKARIEKEKTTRKAKKVPIKKAEKAEKKKVLQKAKKKFTLPLQRQVEIKKLATRPQKMITLKEIVSPKKIAPERRGRVFILEGEERHTPRLTKIMPEGYGENNIVIMTVDPWKLFIYWEVTKYSFRKFKGSLNIRLYDITGVDFDGINAKSHVDIAIYNRIGNLYLAVNPEKEFIADIGFIESGIFRIVARSNKASTPRSEITEKGILPHRLYETGLEITSSLHPIGYQK